MTCIAGLVHDGKVYMGADSAATSPWHNQISLVDGKVFTNGLLMVFGTCGTVRLQQLLHYAFVPPRYNPEDDIYKYMTCDFADAVRNCFKAGGYARRDNEAELGGLFFVAFRGHLFRMEDNYQTVESADGYDAIGSGQDLALGSLFTSATQEYLGPKERITLALEAAERFNAGVRRPFRIEVLES